MKNNIFMVDNDKKNDYLKDIKLINQPETHKLYTKLLYKLDEFEQYKNNQITNMTKLDFMEFFTSLNTSSISVLNTYKSALNSYLLFVTDKTKYSIGLLQLDLVTQDDLDKCLDKESELKQFITEEEYYKLIQEDAGNYQDKAIVILLWHQVKGLKQYNEILNLKTDDISIIDKTIQVEDRIIYLDDIETDIFNKALKEQFYKKLIQNKDGVITETEVPYAVGDYFIKATAWRRNMDATNNQCSYSAFANRLTNYFNLALKRAELTGLKIYKSSVYYYMLLENQRKLTISEIQAYADINNIRISLSNAIREQDIMYNKLEEQGLI